MFGTRGGLCGEDRSAGLEMSSAFRIGESLRSRLVARLTAPYGLNRVGSVWPLCGRTKADVERAVSRIPEFVEFKTDCRNATVCKIGSSRVRTSHPTKPTRPSTALA
jgi:hypothetical protein